MSDEEVNEKKDVHEDTEVEEREDSELPFLSIQDIEVLMKNTEIWDKLLQGKIDIEEAKREFEKNGKDFDGIEDKKKAKKQAARKARSTKRKSKKKEEEVEEKEVPEEPTSSEGDSEVEGEEE